MSMSAVAVAVAEDWPERLTGAQLDQAIALLSAQINTANHRLLKMIAEFDRRALREWDGVYRYPGCQESEYVDAYHIRHWAEGGETPLDNLVTLCRFHHRQLHLGCLDIRLNGVSAEIFSNC